MKHSKLIGSVMMISSLITLEAIAASNIDSSDKYAWSENSGWSNFNDTNGSVTVYNDHLEGYDWAENIGWIRLTMVSTIALALSPALLGAKMRAGLNSTTVIVI